MDKPAPGLSGEARPISNSAIYRENGGIFEEIGARHESLRRGLSWEQVFELIVSILTTQTGLPNLIFKQVIMMAIAFFFLYLAVAKNYEPLLLVPIGFGIFEERRSSSC